MASAGPAQETRRLISQSVQEILSLPPDAVDTGPFNKLKTAVSRASSGKSGRPEELLGDVVAKDKVLAYLLRVHKAKRMYQKQVAVTLCTLAELESWSGLIRADAELMEAVPELREALSTPQEVMAASSSPTAAPPAAPSPAPTAPPAPIAPAATPTPAAPAASPTSAPAAAHPPSGAPAPAAPAAGGSGDGRPHVAAGLLASPATVSEVPTETAIRRAIEVATAKADPAKKPTAPSEPTPEAKVVFPGPDSASAATEQLRALEQLLRAATMIRELGFAVSDLNVDQAITAFEQFRAGVLLVTQSVTDEDDKILAALDDKHSYLEFFTAFKEKKRPYRNRVDSLVTKLMQFESWEAAVRADASASAEFRHLFEEAADEAEHAGPTGHAAPKAELGKTCLHKAPPEAKSLELELKEKAATCTSRGGQGALLVRVVRGSNLDCRAADCNPYVSVTLEGKTQRTEVLHGTTEPVWNASPFYFGVPAATSIVRVQVMNEDILRDVSVGHFALQVCKAPKRVGLPLLPQKLEGVSKGTLEVEIVYAPPPDVAPAPALAAPAPAAAKPHAVPPHPWAAEVAPKPAAAAAGAAPPGFAPPAPAAAAAATAASAGTAGAAAPSAAAGAGTGAGAAPALAASPVAGRAPHPWASAGASSPAAAVPPPSPAPAGAAGAAAAGGYPSRPEAGVAAGTWAIWLSIDPRKGDPIAYPAPISAKLEAAWAAGQDRIDLGAEHFGATVDFGHQMQYTKGGARDVRRIEVKEKRENVSVVVHLSRGSSWRITADRSAPGAEVRTLTAQDSAVPAQRKHAGAPATHAPKPAAAPLARPAGDRGGRGGSPPATGATGATEGAGRAGHHPGGVFVAWLSVEPRSGELQAYPAAKGKMLEMASRAKQPNFDFGSDFHNIQVVLDPARMEQVTGRGRRDVLRREVAEETSMISVDVVHNGYWREARLGEPGAKQVSLRLRPEDVHHLGASSATTSL